MKQFDIIVIGAGAAGLNIAMFMHKAGFAVLLVERTETRIGGDCLNYGCVPSKALIHASRMVNEARGAERFGVHVNGKTDMTAVRQYIEEKQGIIRKHENAAYFRGLGLTVVIGTAAFRSPRSIKVNGTEYSAPKIVIATGTNPRTLDIPGSERIKIHTNETIFSLDKLPERLLIIGGGPIGVEIGQAYGRLGSHVTILEHGEHFLQKEDPEISNVLLATLEKEGVDVVFRAAAEQFKTSSSGEKTLVYKNASGEKKHIAFDEVLVSTGRVANFASLGLDEAGVVVKDGKLVVDSALRTTNKHVYALGDVLQGYQFTHAAEMQARVMINNFFSPIKQTFDVRKIAWVTYTDPEIATFGERETELTRRGANYEVLRSDFSSEDRAIIDGDQNGLVKLFVAKGKILGGTMIGKNSGELVQELILAQHAKIPLKTLFSKTYPYPVKTRINRHLMSQHFAGKLTPFNKKLLRLAYRHIA